MKRTLTNLACLAMSVMCGAFWTARVDAHGTPIKVTLADDTLVVSGGQGDSAGFAPMIFAEDDDDGEPFGTSNLSEFGPATIWQIPGYEISGLAENSGLVIEPIVRPVSGADPAENRVLWYWNPVSEVVERANQEAKLQIRKTPSLHTTLLASSQVAPQGIQLAAPVTGDMGFHNHLVLYAVNEMAPAGAYGFFARLSSTLYEPSEPFLLVLNHGLFDYAQMTEAALAINLAAALPGDFNNDGMVDAADYTVWRDGLESTHTAAEYEVWRSHFGEPNSGNGALREFSAVPEPDGLAVATLGTAILLTTLCPSQRKMTVPVK